MNNYYELRISINPEIEEIVSDICFSNFDCEGVVLAEEAYKDLEMTSTTRGTLRVFLTDLNNNPIEVLKTERELLKERGFSDEELGSWEISLDEKENQDWSKKWKEKWTVTHVTDKIAVVPSWLEYEPKDGEIIITLDPGCAFGTGTHQTTQLCMKAIEKYLKKGDTIADIGTGSGILAICAMKFGASSAYGCDNDETVIDVCIENALINGIEVYPPLEGGSKSPISGWGNQHYISKKAQLNAKDLRNNPTLQEQKLWQYLRKSNLGYKFRRQQPIGNYIVDFFCPELKIIIELDGGQHNEPENINYDKKRDDFLTKQGFRIIRIWNNEIDNNIEGVIEYIKNNIKQQQTPPPNPLPQGAGEGKLHSLNENNNYQGAGESKLYSIDQNSKTQEAGEGKLYSLTENNNYQETEDLLFENQNFEDVEKIGKITFELNTADKLSEKYDFVCANILHNVLAQIMGDLKNIMNDNAKMVLSGILDEKKQVVLDAIEKFGLNIIETIHQDQWTAFVVEK